MCALKLSVVIPTYRRVELLRRLLEALQNQSYPAACYEVIVVSDGPDDLTGALLRLFSSRKDGPLYRFLHLPEKKGPAAARNAGWRMSKGELVVFTDDDCLPDPLWLEAYQRAYQIHGTSQPVCFTGRVSVPVKPEPTDYEKNVAHLATAEFITANCACSRLALNTVRGFDESFPIAWREDSDLQFRLIARGIPVHYVFDALVCHPVREAPWGISLSDQRKSMFNALLFKKHPHLYRERIASHPVWHYYFIIACSLIAALGLLSGATLVAASASLGWLAAVVSFASRRLRGTDRSYAHRAEMLLTSVLIPYISVYWTLHGAWRYKVFFL